MSVPLAIGLPTLPGSTLRPGWVIDQIRLSRNISQAQQANEAGVSRRTVTRLAHGQPVSLDSFVGVIQALQVADHLAALLPDPAIRPVERVRLQGTARQRASRKRQNVQKWAWEDHEDTA